MKLTYIVRKARMKSSGLAPIVARLAMKNQPMAEINTQILVRPDDWDPSGMGQISRPDKLAYVQNNKLLDIRADLMAIHHDLERRGKRATPKIVRMLYTGELQEKASLVQAMQHYIRVRRAEPDISESTLKNFERQQKNVLKFLAHEKEMKVMCADVGLKLLTHLDQYLRNEKGHGQTYTNRIIGFVKTVMDFAVLQEWVEYNPLHSYKYRRPVRKKKIYLTQDELQRMIDFDFAESRLAMVRDLFVFQCFTGLAYAELMRFDRSWIGLGVDGRDWIFTDRQKVHGSSCEIPLFDTARRILEQWRYQVPQLDNQQYNRYLKQIAFMCGIEKRLTTHVGRKTFGNILQENGVSIESISGMYGHADTKMTQSYYVDVSAVKVADETRELRGLMGG
jgi:site-specific recombinase XerD